MTEQAVLVSYLEVARRHEVRLGSGSITRVMSRRPEPPGFQVFVTEPDSKEFRFRLRFGTAQLTEVGIVDDVPDDECERIGMALPAMGVVMSAVQVLQALSEAQIEQVLASEFGWFQVKGDGILRACADAHGELSRQSVPWERRALVRLYGPPAQIRDALTEMRLASEAVDIPSD